jgi:hypothetical protein
VLVLPAGANAATFCVNKPTCTPQGGGSSLSDLQAAIAAAGGGGFPGQDRIEVGAGTYANGPFTAGAGNPVVLVGEGSGSTILRRNTSGPNENVLRLVEPASSASDLGIDLTNGGDNLTGLLLAGGQATRIAVTESTATGNGRIGVALAQPGSTLNDSTISLPTSANTVGVAGQSGQMAPVTVQRSTVSAKTGISSFGGLTAQRVRVTAEFLGAFAQGALTVDHGTVRMIGNGSAVSASSFASALNALPASITARHVTAVGPGVGTGVGIGGQCVEQGGIQYPAPAQATIRNSIVRGFANDLVRSGGTCPDGIQTAPATVDVAYSVFDPAKRISAGPGVITEGAGNQNVDPQLTDVGGGNFKPVQGSPVIDTGDPAAPSAGELTVDLDGNARVQDGNGDGAARRDIGAFEHTFVPETDDGGGGSSGDGGDGGGGGGGPTEITRTLTLAYKQKSDKFKGALRSNQTACLAAKVKVFEKEKGKDPKVGADKTNAAGKWSFEESGADGKFYASVPAKTVPAGTCPAAKSKAKKVG